MVCDLATEAGHQESDVEIWNELSSGSNLVSIDHYYEKGKSPYAGQRADDLNPGAFECNWVISLPLHAAANMHNTCSYTKTTNGRTDTDRPTLPARPGRAPLTTGHAWGL